MKTDTLRHALHDWTDIDVAQFYLAVSLGIMQSYVSFSQVKGAFWTDNPVANTLVEILDSLRKANILEKRDEPDYQYRWNPDFKGSWERN